MILSVDGRPIAGALYLEFNSCLYRLKTAFDPAFARFSPGYLLTHLV